MPTLPRIVLVAKTLRRLPEAEAPFLVLAYIFDMLSMPLQDARDWLDRANRGEPEAIAFDDQQGFVGPAPASHMLGGSKRGAKCYLRNF